MVSLRGLVTLIAIFAPLIFTTINGESESHELRPSDHGLEYQKSAAGGEERSAPEMRSFFGGSSPTSTSSNVAMPKPMDSNSTDDRSWWSKNSGHSNDHVREALLVASVACGVTGVALLLASALIYVFKFRGQRSAVVPPSSAAALSSNDNENKLQIVVRDS